MKGMKKNIENFRECLISNLKNDKLHRHLDIDFNELKVFEHEDKLRCSLAHLGKFIGFESKLEGDWNDKAKWMSEEMLCRCSDIKAKKFMKSIENAEGDVVAVDMGAFLDLGLSSYSLTHSLTGGVGNHDIKEVSFINSHAEISEKKYILPVVCENELGIYHGKRIVGVGMGDVI